LIKIDFEILKKFKCYLKMLRTWDWLCVLKRIIPIHGGATHTHTIKCGQLFLSAALKQQ